MSASLSSLNNLRPLFDFLRIMAKQQRVKPSYILTTQPSKSRFRSAVAGLCRYHDEDGRDPNGGACDAQRHSRQSKECQSVGWSRQCARRAWGWPRVAIGALCVSACGPAFAQTSRPTVFPRRGAGPARANRRSRANLAIAACADAQGCAVARRSRGKAYRPPAAVLSLSKDGQRVPSFDRLRTAGLLNSG